MTTTWIIIIAVIAVAILICFLLAIANYSYERFMAKYKELDQIYIKSNLMPYDFVNMINREYFSGKLQIIQISQVAGDAYGKGKLFLSTSTLSNNSIASFTIIAHEMGHAKQDKEAQKAQKIKLYAEIWKIYWIFHDSAIDCRSRASIFENLRIVSYILLASSALIFLLALLLKLLTISIEKDASKNAIQFLEEIFDEVEMKRAKRFLKDARLTYWADFLKIALFWTALSKKTKLFN